MNLKYYYKSFNAPCFGFSKQRHHQAKLRAQNKRYDVNCTKPSIMKRQVVANHTICQNWTPALLDSSVTNTTCQNVVYTRKLLFLYFVNNTTCLHVGLLRISEVFSVSCEIACRWVTTNCCSMSDIAIYR
jgi:hypothetical protein